MYCKGCDYPLWNLSARVCPECGHPFSPSEYDFVPNSVRFCCPNCNQDYYGTGLRGHLLPPEFECVRCHQHITMDQMVLLPTQGVTEEQTKTDNMPWLERHKIGRVKAWFMTVWRSLFEPGRLARSTPKESSAFQAWWFTVITTSIYALLGTAPIWLFIFSVSAAMPRGARGGAIGSIAGGTLGAVAAYIFLVPVWAGIAHLLLRLTGPTESTYNGTLRPLAYASGANILIAIPCVGIYGAFVTWIWLGLSAAFMLRISQRVSVLRALIAVFSPVVVVLVGLTSLGIWGVASARQSFASASFTSAGMTGLAETAQVVAGLFAHVDAKAGAFPDHALRLVHENHLTAAALTAAGDAAAPVGNTTLAQFILLPADDEKSLVTIVAGRLPKDVIAYRLGDYVFTYHGIDLTTADHNLWVVIQWPLNPPAPGTPASPFINVGTVGRGTRAIPRSAFSTSLTEQNQLRADAGLPPLPDPSQVTNDNPATPGSSHTTPPP